MPSVQTCAYSLAEVDADLALLGAIGHNRRNRSDNQRIDQLLDYRAQMATQGGPFRGDDDQRLTTEAAGCRPACTPR